MRAIIVDDAAPCGLTRYYGKKVSITGACGFVGSHLARRLVQLGACLTILDLKQPSPDLEKFIGIHRFIDFDLTQYDSAVERIVASAPDMVIHVAAYGVHSRDRDLELALAVNVAGSIAVVDGAAKARAERIIQIGTSHEYGSSKDPIAEDYCPNPQGTYGATKAAGMIMGRSRAQELGTRWLGLRPFTVYGPGDQEDKLIPYMISNATSGRPVVTTRGDQIRDFIYIDDLVEGIALAAVCDLQSGDFLNLGSGQAVRLGTLFELIQRYFPEADLQIGGRPKRHDDIGIQVACTTKMKLALNNWTPSYSLNDGLQKTIEMFRKKEGQ